MVFSSMIFLWVFLPIVIFFNFLIGRLPLNNKILVKNRFLLVMSFIFYAFGGIYYFFIMLLVILINYLGAIFLTKYEKYKKVIFITTLVLNLLIIFYFKYFNMFLEEKFIVLPIGISFYTFQSMSYLIDVYNKKAIVEKNIFDLALYISFFPQLVAGPIVKYTEISNFIKNRTENAELFSDGVRRFIYGLSKKVLLANQLALVVDNIWNNEIKGAGSLTVLTASILYSFQIYYDFSGYSDMAIGLGKMFGFIFNENFNYPYLSTSITDFWRRWHISLSSWFKEYVYIPLGGNRTNHTYRNLFIVFLLTGIWHGADYSFFLWGALYGVIIIIEKILAPKIHFNEKFKFINIILTFIIVTFLWIPFRAENLNKAIIFIKEFGNFKNATMVKAYFDLKLIIISILSIFFCGIHYASLHNTYEKFKDTKLLIIIESIVLFILLFLCIINLTNSTYNPFIYFQF